MRASVTSALICLVLALAMTPQCTLAQAARDYLFTDEDGHLVLRFVGVGNDGLDSSQAYEILNQEFSRMVHDRLHADLQFAAEARDPEWAASMEPQIAEHVGHSGPDFSDIFVECRAASCRVILEQPVHWSIEGHMSVLDTVQASLEAFVSAHRQHFEPSFLMTAYYQENAMSHIKAFLRRTSDAPSL